MLPVIDDAIAALERGELIGVPTDTVYGVAADPSRREAVEALFAAKGRPGVKPIPILCADVAQARTVGILEDAVAEIAERHWPGGLTLVVRRVAGLADWVGDPEADTVGLRVPDHPAALAVLRRFGPLAVTSANRTGDEPATDDGQARTALGDAVAVYLEGRGSGGPPSTVVDATDDPPCVLRSGAVEWGVS